MRREDEKQHGKEVCEDTIEGGKESKVPLRDLSRELRWMIWRHGMAESAPLQFISGQDPLVDLTLSRTDTISQAGIPSLPRHSNLRGSEDAHGETRDVIYHFCVAHDQRRLIRHDRDPMLLVQLGCCV